jgi:hypothetical protein
MPRIAAGVIAVFLTIAVQPSAALGKSGRTATAKKPPVTSPRRSIGGPAAPVIDIAGAVRAGVREDGLALALKATACATTAGAVDEAPPTLTLIDYSRPSTEPRLWVFDLHTGDLLFTELVAHGRNTGDNFATRFSNDMNSRQSSIGLFVADEPYFGANGYSLRLDGLDEGFNDRARDRAIVLHGAPYVDARLAATQGRIGRSWGCPALRPAIAEKVIDRIRGGGVIFSYYPDHDWLKTSRFLNGCTAAS